jgi:hypothetical protein
VAFDAIIRWENEGGAVLPERTGRDPNSTRSPSRPPPHGSPEGEAQEMMTVEVAGRKDGGLDDTKGIWTR